GLRTGCADKQVRLWRRDNHQLERTFSGPTLSVAAVAYSPRGDRVAACSADKALFVWEAATAREVCKVVNLPAEPHSVALHPEGKLAACALGDGSVRLFDLATGKESVKLDGHTGAVSAVLFSLKGDQVLSAGADKTVRIRPVAGGAGTSIKHGSAVSALALSKDGARLAVG